MLLVEQFAASLFVQQHSCLGPLQSQDFEDMAVKLKKGQKASASLFSPSPTRASWAVASSSTITVVVAKLPKLISTGNASLDTRLIAHWMIAQKVISSMQSEWQLGSDLGSHLQLSSMEEQEHQEEVIGWGD